MKCTQYGICEQVAFKNARTMIFSKSDGWATVFGRVQKILIFWLGGCPYPNIPPQKCRGGKLTAPPPPLIMSSGALAVLKIHKLPALLQLHLQD